MSEMKLMIPANLDIDGVLRNNEKILNGTKLQKDKLLFICDALVSSRSKHRKQLNQKNEKLVPLSTEILDTTIHDYAKYLAFLIESKVFVADLHFVRGKKCRKYGFNPLYEGQKLKQIVINNYKLKKAYKRGIQNRYDRMKKDTWGYGYLTKWWDNAKLKIDKEAAFNWICEYESQKIELIKQDQKGEKEIRSARAIDTSQDFKQLVLNINTARPYYRFKGDGHRFYNPITNLKKELRSFLTYDGKPLVEIDMKNSQPFLAPCLFNSSFWEPLNGNEDKKIKLEGINKGLYRGIRGNKKYSQIITLLKTSEKLSSKEFPFQKFIKLVADGGFYEFIQQEFQPLYPTRFDKRKNVKKGVLTIFYLNNDKSAFNTPSQTFGEHFPEVHQLFRLVKGIEENLLPVILQRIESFLVLDIVCKEIALRYPEIPLYTIHDSIITTKGNEAIVKDIMANKIQEWTGYRPMLETNELSPLKMAA